MNIDPQPDSANAPDTSLDLADWHARFIQALTARDVAAYAAFLAPDCVVQINNSMPVYSRTAMERAYGAYLALFRTLNIEVLALHGSGNELSAEVILHYILADDSAEVVQCAYFIARQPDGLIASVRVYGNASRVFKPFIRAT